MSKVLARKGWTVIKVTNQRQRPGGSGLDAAGPFPAVVTRGIMPAANEGCVSVSGSRAVGVGIA